jgi:regulator of sirC expression with transglutaminase-like and TPR domain
VDLTARWAELMQRPETDLPLDESALVMAAHANPLLDVPAQLRRLDDVAAQVGQGGTDALCHFLFEELGLRGDRQTYDDPRNSYLDQVLDRRRGIPISLSVLVIEIGRRCGLHLEGVGMPGHFLVRDATSPELLIDAFDGGRRLDRAGCERLLRTVTGAPSELTPSMMSATGRRSILARMLANLDRSFERRADHPSLLWVSNLRLRIPDLPVGDRLHLAGRLGSLGRFDDAADVLDELAGTEPAADRTSRLRGEATTMRARLN